MQNYKEDTEAIFSPDLNIFHLNSMQWALVIKMSRSGVDLTTSEDITPTSDLKKPS